MSNETLTYDELRVRAKQVDTTSEWNGYPSNLRVMYTADTMAELRDLYKAAKAEGHEVNVWELHRQDGWRLWHRQGTGTVHDLNDNKWMGGLPYTHAVDVTFIDDRHDVAFDHVFGEPPAHIHCYDDLREAMTTVSALAENLTDPDILEHGEIVRHFVRDGRILYRVRTGDTGYYYDTHHHCVALEIIEREECDD
jgi:hypothetical protein